MQFVLRDGTVRYLTETIQHSGLSVNDAFHMLKEWFITPANMDTNTTE